MEAASTAPATATGPALDPRASRVWRAVTADGCQGTGRTSVRWSPSMSVASPLHCLLTCVLRP